MAAYKSEDTIIMMAFSPKYTNTELILDYLGNFFIRKSQIDKSDRFNIISFNEDGIFHFGDFTHYGESLFKKVKALAPNIKNINLSEGISLAINLIIDVFKRISGKVFRLIIITDLKTPKITISKYLRELTYQVAYFPFIIDIVRVKAYDRIEDKKLLYFIKPTGGSIFYYDNEDDAGDIIYDLAAKKKFESSLFSEGDEFEITDDTRGLIDFLAAEPIELPSMTDDLETIRCQICGERKNLVECPECGTTSHRACLAYWAKYSNMGKLLPNIFRCQNCFRILKLDLGFVENIWQTESPDEGTEAFLHNANVLGAYNQEELLLESDIGPENFQTHSENKKSIIGIENENEKDENSFSLFEDIEDIELIICPKCGRMTTNEHNFCDNCGSKLI
ncbi:MAG: hypothetical protein GF364_13265 [Candidatus Lokiarchaeota archaeon]|nr:hypothetical protein [Candidatus Lokiarchaeota archaeon]